MKAAADRLEELNCRAEPENALGKSSTKSAENGSSTASARGENKVLTCDGCVNENNDAAQCESCIRAWVTNLGYTDNYARKPEGSEKP